MKIKHIHQIILYPKDQPEGMHTLNLFSVSLFFSFECNSDSVSRTFSRRSGKEYVQIELMTKTLIAHQLTQVQLIIMPPFISYHEFFYESIAWSPPALPLCLPCPCQPSASEQPILPVQRGTSNDYQTLTCWQNDYLEIFVLHSEFLHV